MRHKISLLVLSGLTVVWFIVILFCLPQDDYSDRLPSAAQQKIDNNSKKDGKKVRRSDHNIYPPNSPDFMRYFHQSRHKTLTIDEILFYQFNTIEGLSNSSDAGQVSVASVEEPLSKSEHENTTLKLKLMKSSSDELVKTEGDSLFAFNLLVSNRIGLFRLLPDTRNSKCTEPSEVIRNNASTIVKRASIIICYYNEAPSALLRTITTILKRSPIQLVKEIIVVDDFSGPEFHMDKMKPFIKSNLINFMRTSKREGLIRARLFGAKVAQGDVLIFLDSHVEANRGWLEPLLRVVQDNKTTIACPIIDIINSDTLVYSASPMVKGGMNWALNFKWDSIPSEKLKTYDDFIKPVESPTMAGGLYAIDRDYFYHLGAYDQGMDLWGGENIELSLRTWMCGGRILILPCSRLGHIFRKTRPYGPEPDKPDSLLVNSVRSARVWLADYIEHFYKANPSARHLDSGDISERLDLKQRLQCRNFSWFLDQVYPKLKLDLENDKKTKNDTIEREPVKAFKLKSRRIDRSVDRAGYGAGNLSRQPMITNDLNQFAMNGVRSRVNSKYNRKPKVISRFQIQSQNSNLCIESRGGLLAQSFSRLILSECQIIKHDSDGRIMINSTTDDLLNQLWTETELHDYRLGENQCLDLIKNLPLLRKCHHMGSFQNWNHYNKTHDTLIHNNGGDLCLGVERVKAGEPLIVTICDMALTNQHVSASEPQHNSRERQSGLEVHASFRDRFVTPGWRTGSLSESKQFDLKQLQPSQKWNIIPAGGVAHPESIMTISSSTSVLPSPIRDSDSQIQ